MWLLTGKTLYFFTVLLSGSGSRFPPPVLLDYSCAAPKQAVGLPYPEPDFFPEVQSLSVPLYGEQFRQFPINAEIMSLLESCHLRVLDYFPQEKLYAFYRTSQVVYRLHSSTEYQG